MQGILRADLPEKRADAQPGGKVTYEPGDLTTPAEQVAGGHLTGIDARGRRGRWRGRRARLADHPIALQH